MTDKDAKSQSTANAEAGDGAAKAGQSDDSGTSNSQSPSGFSEMGDSEKREIRVPQVLAGDTLFAGSIGRTDLWGGSMEEIMDSLRSKLMQLPDATIVHPGHGPMTTIGRERETNPFLQPE